MESDGIFWFLRRVWQHYATEGFGFGEGPIAFGLLPPPTLRSVARFFFAVKRLARALFRVGMASQTRVATPHIRRLFSSGIRRPEGAGPEPLRVPPRVPPRVPHRVPHRVAMPDRVSAERRSRCGSSTPGGGGASLPAGRLDYAGGGCSWSPLSRRLGIT